MKKLIASAVTLVFFAQNSMVLYALENASVQSVRVSADNVYIATDRPVEYKVLNIEQPPQMVLELLDSKMKTLQDMPANGQFLRKVRTSQFQTSPVSISRVVMELTQKTAYEITRKGSELVVMLHALPAAAKAPVQAALPPVVQVKAAAADVPAGVKVIAPDVKNQAAARPIEMTLEAAPIKPSDLVYTAPTAAPSKERAQFSRSIMDTLSRDPISFDYSDADIREVIDMLAAKAGVNVIYNDDVSGPVTISLNKVPFDEAFRTLLNMKGLAAQQAGDNILRIGSPSGFIAEQKKALPQTRVFFLGYARAADVKVQVDSVAAAEGRKATCTADEGNNALVVTDSPMGLDVTARLIYSLDRIPKQVLIEAKLVEVSLDDSFDYGVQWSGYGMDKSGAYFGAGDASSPIGPTAALGTPSSILTNYKNVIAGTAQPAGPTANSQSGTGVNLPANVVYGAFRLGKVASNYMFDTIITAAAKKGKAKVLSDPKVATLNNKEASINITTQIPYTTSDTTVAVPPVTTTRVVYLTTGIVLKVTPTINPDGRISMKINPSISQVSLTVAAVTGGAPGIDTRSADTSVIVRNGETIVIGGLISDTQSEAVYKVPLLGDIPLLGWLFKKKSMSRNRMELLIFVTPRILEN